MEQAEVVCVKFIRTMPGGLRHVPARYNIGERATFPTPIAASLIRQGFAIPDDESQVEDKHEA